jgi:hypothetical protein
MLMFFIMPVIGRADPSASVAAGAHTDTSVYIGGLVLLAKLDRYKRMTGTIIHKGLTITTYKQGFKDK